MGSSGSARLIRSEGVGRPKPPLAAGPLPMGKKAYQNLGAQSPSLLRGSLTSPSQLTGLHSFPVSVLTCTAAPHTARGSACVVILCQSRDAALPLTFNSFSPAAIRDGLLQG